MYLCFMILLDFVLGDIEFLEIKSRRIWYFVWKCIFLFLYRGVLGIILEKMIC